MREIDALEIYNMRGHDNPVILAREVIQAASFGKAAIAEHNGKPCAVVGVSPLWPGVWTIWSFGTEDWPRAALSLTKYGKRVLQPFLLERGAHRLQCESRVDHHEAHRWLMSCGAKPDGLMEGYGRDGSDYIMFSWRRPDVLFQAPQAASGPAAA